MNIIVGRYVASNVPRTIPRVFAARLFLLIVAISSALKCSVWDLCCRPVSEKMYEYILMMEIMEIEVTVMSTKSHMVK